MKLEIIIHLVSLDHHKSEDNPTMSSVNVLPTWNLLNEFSKNGSLKSLFTFQLFKFMASFL